MNKFLSTVSCVIVFFVSIIILCPATLRAQEQIQPSYQVNGDKPIVDKGAAITGSVSMAGNPNAVIPVHITLSKDGVVKAERTTVTGQTFSFATADLETGDYTVRAEAPANELSPLQTATVTVTLRQLGRTWSAGDGIAGGRITSPQNQTLNPVVPLEVLAGPDREVPCAVEAATDEDSWVSGDLTGDQVDAVTSYRWQASGGRWKNGSSGRNVTWIAPTQAGVYTISCTIYDSSAPILSPDDGTRDDAAVTRTVQVKVPPKNWAAGSGIGVQEIRDEQGTVTKTILSGRIVAPQDQRFDDVADYAPHAVKARISTLVPCSVETAIDHDTWAQHDVSGEKDDEIPNANYRWSGGDGVDSGFFVAWKTLPDGTIEKDANDQPKAILTTEATGTTVLWKAPSVSGVTTTVTCTIKDLPQQLSAGETGTRDDIDLVRTVNIDSYDPTSWAELHLYRHINTGDGLGAEVTTLASGWLHAVLEVQVGGNSKVADASLEPRLRYEENDVRHGKGRNDITLPDGSVSKEPGENHWNQAASFGGTWQKWTGTDWSGTGAPSSPNNTDKPIRYRKIFSMWNSGAPTGLYDDPDGPGPIVASRMLGHNGPHRVSLVKADTDSAATIQFQEKQADGSYANSLISNPGAVAVDIQNIIVTPLATNAGNSDYFKFDPAADASPANKNPVVRFSFSNNGDTTKKTNRYHWWLWIRETTENGPSNFITYEGNADEPGIQEITINQESTKYARTAGNALSNWGTYAFDIRVQDTANGDMQDIRSTKIEIPFRMWDKDGQPMKDANGEPLVDEDGLARLGHDVDFITDDDDTDFAKVSYLLKSAKNGSAMSIDLVDPYLSTKVSRKDFSPVVDKPNVDINLFTFPQDNPAGDYKGVFTATDNYLEIYRNHANRPMLAINKGTKTRVLVEYQYQGYKRIVSPYYENGKYIQGFLPKLGHLTGDKFALRVKTVPLATNIAQNAKWSIATPTGPLFPNGWSTDFLATTIGDGEPSDGNITIQISAYGVTRNVTVRSRYLQRGSGTVSDPTRNETWLALTADLFLLYHAGVTHEKESVSWQGKLRSTNYYDGSNGGQLDVARHSYWNALMASELSRVYDENDGGQRAFDFAKLVGDAHEVGNVEGQSGISLPVSGIADRFRVPNMVAKPYRVPGVMDLNNNEYGRNVGRANRVPASISNENVETNRSIIRNKLMTAINEGDLIIIDQWNEKTHGTNGNYAGMLRPSNRATSDGFWKTRKP